MNLARSFLIYTASSVTSGAVPFLLLPVLTRYLSAEDYGVIATLTTLVTFMAPPIMWGTHALLAVEFNRLQPAARPRFFSTLVIVPLCCFVVLWGGIALLAPFGADVLRVPSGWIRLTPVLALLGVLPLMQLVILRMQGRPVAYGMLEISTAVLTLTLTLIFVVGLSMSWEGRLWSLALSSAIMTIVAIARLIRNGFLVRRIDRARLSEVFRFGSGVVPHELFSQAIRLTDRLIIVGISGLASAGQYAVATQVMTIMVVLLSAFNRAWSPYVYSRLPDATDDTRRDIVRKSYAAIGAFGLASLLFNGLVPFIYLYFINSKFSQSETYVPWLSLGYFFMAVYLTYVDYIFYVKKTHILSVMTFFNLSTNVVLNIVFIRRYGAQGATYAFACTMFLVMVAAFMVSRKVYPMPWFYWIKSRLS